MSRTVQKEKQKSTKKYDAVAKKIRKLLSASAQTFIPELCEALREDWFSEYTNEQIKNVKEARENIRDKIFEDWSYEHGGKYSEDNIWSNSTIRMHLSDWLRNPNIQTESNLEQLARMREEKMRRKSLISEREKKKLDVVATNLPDNVIIPEQKHEEKLTPLEEEDEQELYGYGLGKFGDTDKSPRELLGDVTDSAANLFEALMVGRKKIPHSVDADMIVDYIKPTREEWKSLMLEADKTQRARVHNWLSFLADVIEDRLEILKVVENK